MGRTVSIAASFLLLVGLVIGVFSSNASAAIGTWQKSVMIQSRWNTDFASTSFNQSVDKAIGDGANYIVLIVNVHQANIYTTDVQTGNDTPTDQALTAGVNYIHSKGAHAVINIHDDPYDGQWRALINPSDRAGWFASYGKILQHYAQIAQATGIEQMVLGTEMASMTSPNYNSSNTAYWQSMIQSVRSVYSGQLTYSAQHDGYMSDLASIGFWPQLDFIGVSAYYGMGYDSSVNALKAQWANVYNSYLSGLSARYGKQILFTEVGFASKSGSLADPGTAYQQGGGYDPTLQANAYQAMFDYWNNIGSFAGVALWDWSSDPNAGGNGNVDYTPQNKPAEAVMKQYFTTNTTPSGGMGGGSLPTPTPTPTPQPTPVPMVPTTYSLTAATSTATVGVQKTVTVALTANQAASGVLVDLEVYDASGNKVAQVYKDNQTASNTPTNYTVSWTPNTAGTYTIKGGVFAANWSSNLVWNNEITKVSATNVAQPTPAPTPPAPIPTPVPPTPAPTPAPTPTSPTSAANLSIWWPGATQAVSGLQPFKAVLDGVDQSKYKMYWQVDGDNLNEMTDNAIGGNHKESLVNLTGWNWSGNHKYTITFVAKDTSNAVLVKKSVVITIY